MAEQATKNNWPTLSVVMVNRNDARRMKTSLESIRMQDYPKEKIEILIIDGGSTDTSETVAKEFGAKFIEGGFAGNQEARRGVGATHAKNEILVYLDTDNYLPHSEWFQKMVHPLIEDREIFASQTLWYAYRKTDTLFNRYCSLFGVNDPVAYYLSKQDRLTHYQEKWVLKGSPEDKGNYYKIVFTEDLPTVGCNGFLIRREVLLKVVDDFNNFFHIDVIYDLIKRGHKNIAFVKDEVIHDTSATLLGNLKKRISYYASHSVELKNNRRYKVFDTKNKRDVILLLKYILYSVTIIKPLWDATKGFVKKPDIAWFMHPVACIAFLFAYGLAVIKNIIKK